MKTISTTLGFESKNLMQIMNVLSSTGLCARLIGGCVRDKLLGISAYDIDIATPLRPDVVTSLLVNNGVKVIPTGIDFGTVTALVGEEAFEITSLRKDIKCDGRRAIVEFTEDFALDAARRDFTVNALSYSPFEHKIYDYFNGLEDLEAGRIKFIGTPAGRIEEDYLRILRFFRFSARYSNEIDEAGFKACVAFKDNLSKLPRERINVELDKLLGAKNATPVLESMIRGGIDIMRGLKLSPVDILVSDLKLPGLYAILLRNNDFEILSKVLSSLRFSKKRVREVADMVNFIQRVPGLDDFVELWIDGLDVMQYVSVALNLNILSKSEAQELKVRFRATPPKLPVNGNDLRSHFDDREIGKMLLKIKKLWIESGLKADMAQLMRML